MTKNIEYSHYAVLTNKIFDIAYDTKVKNILDCTFGMGEHSKYLSLLCPDYIDAIDLDECSKQFCASNINLIIGNFADIDSLLNKYYDFVLIDLGISIYQIMSDRGFSFKNNNFLDMRININQKIQAADILNIYSKDKLSYIFKTFGGEVFHEQIAYNICKYRLIEKICTTFQLNEIILKVKGFLIKKHSKKNIFMQVYQALRIVTNNEIYNIKQLLFKINNFVQQNAIILIVSFNSLESKIIINSMKQYNWNLIYKFVPNRLYEQYNCKHRSAILRVYQKYY